VDSFVGTKSTEAEPREEVLSEPEIDFKDVPWCLGASSIGKSANVGKMHLSSMRQLWRYTPFSSLSKLFPSSETKAGRNQEW
jgi:hypothetical protein